jgi:hypothetical protein
VLSDTAFVKLTAVMLFVQAKRLHGEQESRAASAAPRTGRSGRAKKQGGAGEHASSQAVHVRLLA